MQCSVERGINCSTFKSITCCYSLAPGVSFDLLQRLYKLKHPTSLCCRAYISYMHCGPDIGIAELSVTITPGAQAINQLKHPIFRDLAIYPHSALGRVYQQDPTLGCFN